MPSPVASNAASGALLREALERQLRPHRAVVAQVDLPGRAGSGGGVVTRERRDNRPGASVRLLLGTAFALAVLWKVVSPAYLDGRFFRVTLLTDDRFADTTLLLGGLGRLELEHNRRALAPLPQGAELMDPPAVLQPPRFRALAAAGAASPWRPRWPRSISFPLLGAARRSPATWRCCSSGWRPTRSPRWPAADSCWPVMGLAGCQADQRALRFAYVGLFFLVLFYAEVPWTGLISQWRG